MLLPIYAKHQFKCPRVSHCPHLGGASVIHVAQEANRSKETRESSLRQIRTLEKRNCELFGKQVTSWYSCHAVENCRRRSPVPSPAGPTAAISTSKPKRADGSNPAEFRFPHYRRRNTLSNG